MSLETLQSMFEDYLERLSPRGREAFKYILGAVEDREEMMRRVFVLLTRADADSSRDSRRLDYAIHVTGIDGLDDFDITEGALGLVAEWHEGRPDGQEWNPTECDYALEIKWREALDYSKDKADKEREAGHDNAGCAT